MSTHRGEVTYSGALGVAHPSGEGDATPSFLRPLVGAFFVRVLHAFLSDKPVFFLFVRRAVIFFSFFSFILSLVGFSTVYRSMLCRRLLRLMF